MSKPFFLVAVHDRKANSFSGVTPVPSLEVGERMYSDLLCNGGDVIGRHPEDFELYHLGFFDPDTGKVDGLDIPSFVANSEEVKHA